MVSSISEPETSFWLARNLSRDREVFLKLWEANLVEQYHNGSGLRASDHNLAQFGKLYDAYTSGRLAGTVVFATTPASVEPIGVAMGGDSFMPNTWETDDPKTAILWGVYVDPAHRGQGIGHQMEVWGEPHLKGLGFKAAASVVRPNNPGGQVNFKSWETFRGIRVDEIHFTAYLGDRDERI
jgi:GNAT superfamily N-acetyltransferase